MNINVYRTKKIRAGDDLFAILKNSLPRLKEKSIVVVTSKIVSLCENQIVHRSPSLDKQILAQQESDYFVDPKHSKLGFTITIKNNILIMSGGVDESNVDGDYVLWPKNPQQSAVAIWQFLKDTYKLEHVGVVITDSKLSPLRWGVTGVGIAFCGFLPLNDYRGTPDIFGRILRVTQVNVIDALSAAAVLVMGEGREQTPLAVIADVPFVQFSKNAPTHKEIESLKITLADDIYAPLLDTPIWKKNPVKQESEDSTR